MRFTKLPIRRNESEKYWKHINPDDEKKEESDGNSSELRRERENTNEIKEANERGKLTDKPNNGGKREDQLERQWDKETHLQPLLYARFSDTTVTEAKRRSSMSASKW